MPDRPTLTARLLRMVNSVYFGLSTRVNNIEEAVFFLVTAWLSVQGLAMLLPERVRRGPRCRRGANQSGPQVRGARSGEGAGGPRDPGAVGELEILGGAAVPVPPQPPAGQPSTSATAPARFSDKVWL